MPAGWMGGGGLGGSGWAIFFLLWQSRLKNFGGMCFTNRQARQRGAGWSPVGSQNGHFCVSVGKPEVSCTRTCNQEKSRCWRLACFPSLGLRLRRRRSFFCGRKSSSGTQSRTHKHTQKCTISFILTQTSVTGCLEGVPKRLCSDDLGFGIGVRH